LPDLSKKPDSFLETPVVPPDGESHLESDLSGFKSPAGDAPNFLLDAPQSSSYLDRWLIPGILFAATFFTTSFAGLFNSGYVNDGLVGTFVSVVNQPWLLARGFPFSLTLMTILLAHEMGHFLACRYYGIRCTPPFFMPLPLPPVGTLGAFIRIQSPFQHKRALFDVGVAGPLAGFAFVIPALIIGTMRSQVIPKASLGSDFISFGEPLVFRWISTLVVDYNPLTEDMIAHPIAFAGWFGLLVTALNLLPIWQLDGGHMAYALLGPRYQKKLSIVGVLTLVIGSFLGWYLWRPLDRLSLPPYLFFGMLLLILGSRFRFYHPPTLADEDGIGFGRIMVGLLALIILLISFTPVPFS
jgi:membrane-associated protease RseP (regulator of RpoE activity)